MRHKWSVNVDDPTFAQNAKVGHPPAAWKTKSPSTAIEEYGLQLPMHKDRFLQAFINPEGFEVLRSDKPDPLHFWNIRTALIADELFKLQYV